MAGKPQKNGSGSSGRGRADRPASSPVSREARSTHGGTNRGDIATISLLKDLRHDLEGKISAMSATIGHRIQAEVRSGVRAALKDEIRAEIEAEVRDEITHEIRVEMANRLKSMVKDHDRLDPLKILDGFVRHAADLLAESEGRHGDLTQQQLVSTLRQAVLESFQSRKLHLAQLAELDCRLRETGGPESLLLLVDELLTVAGLRRMETYTDHPQHFTIVNTPAEGQFISMVQPAYIDSTTGRVVRSGRLRHVADPVFLLESSGPASGEEI